MFQRLTRRKANKLQAYERYRAAQPSGVLYTLRHPEHVIHNDFALFASQHRDRHSDKIDTSFSEESKAWSDVQVAAYKVAMSSLFHTVYGPDFSPFAFNSGSQLLTTLRRDGASFEMASYSFQQPRQVMQLSDANVQVSADGKKVEWTSNNGNKLTLERLDDQKYDANLFVNPQEPELVTAYRLKHFSSAQNAASDRPSMISYLVPISFEQ